jgi:hypothetical protein
MPLMAAGQCGKGILLENKLIEPYRFGGTRKKWRHNHGK